MASKYLKMMRMMRIYLAICILLAFGFICVIVRHSARDYIMIMRMENYYTERKEFWTVSGVKSYRDSADHDDVCAKKQNHNSTIILLTVDDGEQPPNWQSVASIEKHRWRENCRCKSCPDCNERGCREDKCKQE